MHSSGNGQEKGERIHAGAIGMTFALPHTCAQTYTNTNEQTCQKRPPDSAAGMETERDISLEDRSECLVIRSSSNVATACARKSNTSGCLFATEPWSSGAERFLFTGFSGSVSGTEDIACEADVGACDGFDAEAASDIVEDSPTSATSTTMFSGACLSNLSNKGTSPACRSSCCSSACFLCTDPFSLRVPLRGW